MKLFTALFICFVFLNSNFLYAQTQNKITYCINANEKELLKLINQYRKTKKLPPIKLSPELTKVAKIHAKDLAKNNPDTGKCNTHSWSDKGNWKACCYTDDHKKAALMWSKPAELTTYKSEGFEIAFQSSEDATPAEALAGWKKSSGHNNVIIERGNFNKMGWKAIGIAVEGNYALVWFGKEPDKEPPLTECK